MNCKECQQKDETIQVLKIAVHEMMQHAVEAKNEARALKEKYEPDTVKPLPDLTPEQVNDEVVAMLTEAIEERFGKS